MSSLALTKVFDQFNLHQLFANEIFTLKEISLQTNIYCFAANSDSQRLVDACATATKLSELRN